MDWSSTFWRFLVHPRRATGAGEQDQKRKMTHSKLRSGATLAVTMAPEAQDR